MNGFQSMVIKHDKATETALKTKTAAAQTNAQNEEKKWDKFEMSI